MHINDSLDVACWQIILQSPVTRCIPSALVQTPHCRLTIRSVLVLQGTSILKTLLRTRVCFQKEREFFLPILVALDIQMRSSTYPADFLLLKFFTSCSLFFNYTSSIWRCNGALSFSTTCGKAASLNVAESLSKSWKRSAKSCNTASKALENRSIGMSSTCISLLSIRAVSCGKWKKLRCWRWLLRRRRLSRKSCTFFVHRQIVVAFHCRHWFRLLTWVRKFTRNARDVRKSLFIKGHSLFFME